MIAAITLDSPPVTLGGLVVGFEVEGLVSPAGIGLSASICDDVSGIPGSAVVVCLLAAAAGWLLDTIRRG